MSVDDFLRRLKENGYSEWTLVAYRNVLKRFVDGALSSASIRSFQQAIVPLKPNTRGSYLRLLRQYVRAVAPQLEKEIVMPRKQRVLPKDIPSQAEMTEILAKPDVTEFNGIRDRAILEVLYATGIRRQELLQLKVRDVESEKQVVRVNLGKGKKDRLVPISSSSVAWVEKYVCRVRSVLKAKTEVLFVSVLGLPLSRSELARLVKRYGSFSPHKYRHAFATHLLEGGMKETSLQRLLGHRFISTTQIYTQVTAESLKASYQKYHGRDRWAGQ